MATLRLFIENESGGTRCFELRSDGPEPGVRRVTDAAVLAFNEAFQRSLDESRRAHEADVTRLCEPARGHIAA